jgi:hypothetical protein
MDLPRTVTVVAVVAAAPVREAMPMREPRCPWRCTA